MKKKLKDLKLTEIISICNNHLGCDGCPFFKTYTNKDIGRCLLNNRAVASIPDYIDINKEIEVKK